VCEDLDIGGVKRFHGDGKTLEECKEQCLSEEDCVAIYGSLESGDGSCWTFPDECKEEAREDDPYKIWHVERGI